MKKIFLVTVLFIFSISSFAGSFSEIDLTVRDLVTYHYTQNSEGEPFEMDYYEDIWGLNLVCNYEFKSCLAVISGYANAPTYDGHNIYKFWFCLTQESDGDYSGYILDEVQVD